MYHYEKVGDTLKLNNKVS